MKEQYDEVLNLTAITFRVLGIKGFNPQVSQSLTWIKWVTNFSINTCLFCSMRNGKIYDKDNVDEIKPPVHENCACFLDKLLTIMAGTATIDGFDGADYWIKQFNRLPNNYISRERAIEKGWKNIYGNLRNVIPNATIGGNYYGNRDGKLPFNTGRIWYEADINYTGGYRNSHRLLYSNDGLIFVTYDHYTTFYEIR